MLILSGDIGGTNTRLQLSDRSLHCLHQQDFKNIDFGGLSEIVELFLEDCHQKRYKIDKVCFAVAGPVIDGTVKFTNLPWIISENDLKKKLGIKSVKIINDFEAMGYGIDILISKNFITLQEEQEDTKNKLFSSKAIIGAGTGLGITIVNACEGQLFVTATEGGHIDFSPTDDEQVALFEYLRKKFARVSLERILSGLGLVNIYKFVRDNPLFGEIENNNLRKRIYANNDCAKAINEYAFINDPMALRTMDIFIKTYGSAAGNLALTTRPTDGIFLCGGIATKIHAQLKDGRFMDAFRDKGRMSNLLNKIPVHIVTDTKIGLKGAANFSRINVDK